MNVIILKDFPDLADVNLGSKTLWREVGLMVRERIVSRTRTGTDVRGSAFKSYSQDYREAKFKAIGKNSPVDLTVSGAMLNAITVTEVTENSVTIGFSS